MVKGQDKRKYSEEFRQGAVNLVLNEKRPVRLAAADLGMPENTLAVWVSQARRGQGRLYPAAGTRSDRAGA